MASPFEIIALAETITGVGHKIYRFFTNLKDAPQEIRELCAELQLLRTVLLRIGMASSRANALQSSTSRNQIFGMETVFACLRYCEVEFNTLWLAVSPLSSERGLNWNKIVEKARTSTCFLIKTDEIEKTTKRLDRLKQTLALSMSLSGIEANTELTRTLGSVEAQIEANGTLLVAQVEELKDTILGHVHQFEHRLMQRVDELSSVAKTQHQDGDLRVAQLTESLASSISGGETGSPADVGVQDYSGANPKADSCTDGRRLSQEQNGSASLEQPVLDGPDTNMPSTTNTQINVDSLYRALSLDGNDPHEEELVRQGCKTVLDTIQATSQRPVKAGIARKLRNRISSSLSDYQNVLNTLTQLHPEYTAVLWGSIRLILEVVAQSRSQFDEVVNVMNEMQDALQMCEREYKLYPEPKVAELVKELCVEMVCTAEVASRTLRGTTSKMLFSINQPVLGMKTAVSKIRGISDKVIREVEYLHRRELRDAHQRLREVDRKQNEVLRMLGEQRRILDSLQEEQKMLSTIADHQKVLQLLQRLLAQQT